MPARTVDISNANIINFRLTKFNIIFLLVVLPCFRSSLPSPPSPSPSTAQTKCGRRAATEKWNKRSQYSAAWSESESEYVHADANRIGGACDTDWNDETDREGNGENNTKKSHLNNSICMKQKAIYYCHILFECATAAATIAVSPVSRLIEMRRRRSIGVCTRCPVCQQNMQKTLEWMPLKKVNADVLARNRREAQRGRWSRESKLKRKQPFGLSHRMAFVR